MPGASPKQVDLPAPLGSTWKSSFHGSGWSNLPLGAPQTYPNCWAQKDCVRTQQDPLLFAENSRRIKFLTPVLCCSRSSSIFFAARWSKSLPSAAAGKKGCGENRAMTFHHLPPQKQRAVYNPKSQLSPENMSIGAQFARAVHDQVWPLWLTKLSPNHCTSTEPSSCPWCPYLIVLMLKEIFFSLARMPVRASGSTTWHCAECLEIFLGALRAPAANLSFQHLKDEFQGRGGSGRSRRYFL